MLQRRVLALSCALVLATLAQAQTRPPPAPPPPIPPPYAPSPAPPAPVPPDIVGDPDLEPQVTIVRREAETVEEVRVGGELRYIRVTPRFGLPYFLFPTPNGQAFIRRDSLGTGLSVPMWQLFSW
ncbi:MAG: DUF2782 domain-containing protein [Burkholderiales bacterium]|nr:DUF2782 domain-containing protein [Burkholderiales bacterium]